MNVLCDNIQSISISSRIHQFNLHTEEELNFNSDRWQETISLNFACSYVLDYSESGVFAWYESYLQEFYNFKISSICVKLKDKKEEIWLSPMTEAPNTNRNVNRAVTTQTTPQKSSITQRLWTDLGRSVGKTTATQLVWLTGLRAHLPTYRNSRVIKRTQICK